MHSTAPAGDPACKATAESKSLIRDDLLGRVLLASRPGRSSSLPSFSLHRAAPATQSIYLSVFNSRTRTRGLVFSPTPSISVCARVITRTHHGLIAVALVRRCSCMRPKPMQRCFDTCAGRTCTRTRTLSSTAIFPSCTRTRTRTRCTMICWTNDRWLHYDLILGFFKLLY
jgi:hypothetical protein